MGFFRQEYWIGLPFSLPGDLPDPVIEPTPPASLAFTSGSFTTEPCLGKGVLKSSVTFFDLLIFKLTSGIHLLTYKIHNNTQEGEVAESHYRILPNKIIIWFFNIFYLK